MGENGGGFKILKKTADNFNRSGHSKFEGIKWYNRTFGGKVATGGSIALAVMVVVGATIEFFGGDTSKDKGGKPNR